MDGCFFSFKVFSLAIVLISLLSYARLVQGNLWAGSGMEEMMFNAHERELPPMDFRAVNCEEFLHEPYIPEPILEPRFPVESVSSGPS